MLTKVKNLDNYYHFHLCNNGPVIGQFALVDQGNKNALKIVAFAIYGEHRNKGYGQQMMREAIAEANKIKGNRLLCLDVMKSNSKAIHIYTKYGFEVAGDFGPEAYTMVYKLSKLPTLKVSGIQQVDLRQFYDSKWVIKFTSGSWCELTRYDTDNAAEIIRDVERCRCIPEVETKCDFRSKILYD